MRRSWSARSTASTCCAARDPSTASIPRTCADARSGRRPRAAGGELVPGPTQAVEALVDERLGPVDADAQERARLPARDLDVARRDLHAVAERDLGVGERVGDRQPDPDARRSLRLLERPVRQLGSQPGSRRAGRWLRASARLVAAMSSRRSSSCSVRIWDATLVPRSVVMRDCARRSVRVTGARSQPTRRLARAILLIDSTVTTGARRHSVASSGCGGDPNASPTSVRSSTTTVLGVAVQDLGERPASGRTDHDRPSGSPRHPAGTRPADAPPGAAGRGRGGPGPPRPIRGRPSAPDGGRGGRTGRGS